MRLRVRSGIPSHSSSLALRFAIALPDASSAKRLKVADEVIGYCEQQGFGLWLADTRLGYGIGSWYQMRSIQKNFLMLQPRSDENISPGYGSRSP